MPMLKDPRWSAINFDGTPCAGARMYVYDGGTDNLAAIYSDAAMTVRAENPLVANGFGVFPVVFTPAGETFKVRIETDLGVLISQVDGLTALPY